LEPEPFPLEPEDRLRALLVERLRVLLAGLLLDFAAGLLVDLPDPLLLFAAGRAFFVVLALVDFDLRDGLGRAAVELFFV
jgi:hypothetical protein